MNSFTSPIPSLKRPPPSPISLKKFPSGDWRFWKVSHSWNEYQNTFPGNSDAILDPKADFPIPVIP